jgi:hypothetical protein
MLGVEVQKLCWFHGQRLWGKLNMSGKGYWLFDNHMLSPRDCFFARFIATAWWEGSIRFVKIWRGHHPLAESLTTTCEKISLLITQACPGKEMLFWTPGSRGNLLKSKGWLSQRLSIFISHFPLKASLKGYLSHGWYPQHKSLSKLDTDHSTPFTLCSVDQTICENLH